MIQAEVQHPRFLSDRDIFVWQAYCAASPALRSPLLRPEFAQLVGEVREDARVAVFRQADQTVGFLPFHQRPNGFARPIGAPFSDYHAIISAPGETLDVREALAAAHIGAYRFHGLIDPQGAAPGGRPSGHRGHVIELAASASAHHSALKAANPKRYKNWRRLQNKIEREVGEVKITPGDRSQGAFEQLLAWKRDQFRRTGTHDVLRPDWAQSLFQRAFERRKDDVHGVMTTLSAGGRLIAGHFGIAIGGVCHVWISSIDPAYAAFGPGQVLMLQAPEIMEWLGLNVYDLGPGYAHYKTPFATGEVEIREGLAMAAGPASAAAQSMENAWAVAGENRIQAVGRLKRRLDHIAAAELSLGGRLRGLVEALAASGRRQTSREPARAETSLEGA